MSYWYAEKYFIFLLFQVHTIFLLTIFFLLKLHSKQKYATHTELYLGNIIAKKNAHITASYKISEHLI